MRLYIIRKLQGINAIAEYEAEKRVFKVLKNSVVSQNISEAKTFRGAKTVKTLREKYVKNNIVQEDIVFNSSSTAANFVTGSSTDGLRTWKNEEGKSLKAIISGKE